MFAYDTRMEIEKPLKKMIIGGVKKKMPTIPMQKPGNNKFGMQAGNNKFANFGVQPKKTVKNMNLNYLWDNFRRKDVNDSVRFGPIWMPIKNSTKKFSNLLFANKSKSRLKSIMKSQPKNNSRIDFRNLNSIINRDDQTLWSVIARITPQKREQIKKLIAYLESIV